jgi:hypothetical protein
MAEPIVFVSHFAVKAAKLEGLKRLARDTALRLEAEKPETLLYLEYLDDDGTSMTFVHLFADARAMDRHFEGASERSSAALEFMDPSGWEIYGMPSEAALSAIRVAARSAGVPLTLRPEYLAGFARLRS